MSAAGRPDSNSQTLAPGDFARLAAFISRTSGIKMPPTKRTMVEGRLRRRLTETGAGSFAAYCQMVFDGGADGPEIVQLIDAVTTNKTDFFREPEHFRVLTETVLPGLPPAQSRAKLWSAACSTGAEPYTMAMVISEFLANSQARPPRLTSASILATDLSSKVLATAQRGIYPAEMIVPVPPALRPRYLLRAKDRASGLVRLAPSLRAMVRFGRMNLMAETYPVDRDFDVIFCRNVLIYFDRNTQAAVLRRLCQHLRPGGTLAVGHSETLNGLDLPLQPIGHSIFRRS